MLIHFCSALVHSEEYERRGNLRYISWRIGNLLQYLENWFCEMSIEDIERVLQAGEIFQNIS